MTRSKMTQSGHHGSPLERYLAEIAGVKDRSSVKDLLGPVGADNYRQDHDQAREDIKKKGWKAKLDRRRRFARGAPASPARPRSAG
jgi:hypothetical protein